MRQSLASAAGASDAGLAALGKPEAGTIDPRIGPWTSYFANYRLGDYASVTGYRTIKAGNAVTRFSVGNGGTFKGGGTIYFTRIGKIEGRFDSDYDSIILKSTEGDRSYVLLRTNPSVTPDFFGKQQAEFAMTDETLKRFLSENDENTDFFVQYRPEAKGSLRPFVIGTEKNSVKVNLGDLVRAYRWAMAPSAI